VNVLIPDLHEASSALLVSTISCRIYYILYARCCPINTPLPYPYPYQTPDRLPYHLVPSRPNPTSRLNLLAASIYDPPQFTTRLYLRPASIYAFVMVLCHLRVCSRPSYYNIFCRRVLFCNTSVYHYIISYLYVPLAVSVYHQPPCIPPTASVVSPIASVCHQLCLF
jgi:hypothetical protein